MNGKPKKSHPEDIQRSLDKIAENLRSLLDERGVAATKASEAAGLSRTTISDIIGSGAVNPTYSTLLKLANYFEVDILRITIGPECKNYSAEMLEKLSLVLELSPQEIGFLLAVAKARSEGLDHPNPEALEEVSKHS